jgi:small subunit ribosomal protein S8
MNYLIGDLIIRLKNAALARKKEVEVPFSNVNKAITQVLAKEGFLESTKEEAGEGKKTLIATLRYVRRKPVITDVDIVSKPSLRVYISKDEIMKNQGRAQTAVISTNSGVMTGREAQKKGLGGELLFRIW